MVLTGAVLAVGLLLADKLTNWTFHNDRRRIEVPIGVMFLTLCGLCTSVMWGTIFNLAVEGLGKYTSMGSGIFMVMVCGGGILPLIQGGVADFAGYLSSYWVVVAGLAYMLFYALVGSKNVNKDIPVEE